MARRWDGNPGPAVQQPWPTAVPGAYPPMHAPPHMGYQAPPPAWPPQPMAPQPVPQGARPPHSQYPPPLHPTPATNPALLSQPHLAQISHPQANAIIPTPSTSTTSSTATATATSSSSLALVPVQPSQADTLEQKRKERDKREKERKEREMRKQREIEAQKQREIQKQQIAAAPKEPRQTNLLKAPSDFLCRMQFRNNLPDIPFDPKLLALPQDPMRYTKCISGSSLENSYKHSLFTETDLGVPINLIDTNLYKIPPGVRAPLDPEDQALIDASVASAPRKGTPGVPHYEKPKVRPSVTWLVKTKYLCNEEDLPQFKAKGVESAPSVYKMKKAGAQDTDMSTLEGQIRAVEDTFEAAKRVPIHPTNPNARPVEILPIYPDFNLWSNLYTEVVFDSNPITSLPHERTVGIDEHDKHYILSNAIVRSCSIKGQQLVAFMTPTQTRKRTREELTEEDEEYEQVSAFHYDVAKDSDLKDNYFFVFANDAVYFNELSTRVKLRKVQSKEEKTMLLGIPKPSSVHVACEEISEETKAERDEKFAQLLQPASAEEAD